MRNFLFIFSLLFAAMSLTAQTQSHLAEPFDKKTRMNGEDRLTTTNGLRMQVTIVMPDGGRRMDFIKISEDAEYVYLSLPGSDVRYSKKYDVVDQRDGDFTIRLLSNAWVKAQLIYEGKELTAVDGAVVDFQCATSMPSLHRGSNDLTDCKTVRLYEFQFGD